MKAESYLLQTVGKADTCELLARTFAYPNEELAHALLDGSFVDDCVSCLADAGCADPESARLFLTCTGDEHTVLSDMRKEYTRLYLNPVRVLIYPFESAFIHEASGLKGKPVLFRTPVTLDVESQMRESGVVPKNALKEPCDSVFQEFEFLSYLYGNLASAIQQTDAESEKLWNERVERFLNDHIMRWMPAFMDRTIRESSGVYGSFARIASMLLAVLERDVCERGGAKR